MTACTLSNDDDDDEDDGNGIHIKFSFRRREKKCFFKIMKNFKLKSRFFSPWRFTGTFLLFFSLFFCLILCLFSMKWNAFLWFALNIRMYALERCLYKTVNRIIDVSNALCFVLFVQSAIAVNFLDK